MSDSNIKEASSMQDISSPLAKREDGTGSALNIMAAD
jgi:hypothetical protein